MEILAQQTSLFIEEKSMSLREVSLAKMQVLQKRTAKVNKGCKVNAQPCFTKWSEQLEKSDQNMLLPKMSQIFLKLTEEQTLDQFSVNFPDWGTMQNGEYVMHQKSVRPTKEPGCIWLHTPVASDYLRHKLSFPMWQRRHHRGAGSLPEHLYKLFGAVPGILNPQLYAWMMGYPLNWLGSNYMDTGTQ